MYSVAINCVEGRYEGREKWLEELDKKSLESTEELLDVC